MQRVFIWIRSSRTASRAGISLALTALLTLPFTFHVYKAWWDYYFPYSGVVIDKGWEPHLVGGFERYLILNDDRGRPFRKYVGYYGHAFTHVGTFVVKRKGFGNYPLSPGEKTPAELRREVERVRASRKTAEPN